MKKSALIVVDVQNDFCEGGALAVAGGAEVASRISEYIADRNYTAVISSRDSHAAPPDNNMGHFALDGEPDYHKSWPVHCVRTTEGEDFHPAFDGMRLSTLTVRKGYGCHSYSAFEGATVTGVTILSYLRSLDIENVDVVGLAYDYCVKATALDAAKLGFKTTVIKRLTASVHPDKDFWTDTILEQNKIKVMYR